MTFLRNRQNKTEKKNLINTRSLSTRIPRKWRVYYWKNWKCVEVKMASECMASRDLCCAKNKFSIQSELASTISQFDLYSIMVTHWLGNYHHHHRHHHFRIENNMHISINGKHHIWISLMWNDWNKQDKQRTQYSFYIFRYMDGLWMLTLSGISELKRKKMIILCYRNRKNE